VPMASKGNGMGMGVLLPNRLGKGKGNRIAVMEHHVIGTECHLPYGITQCYLLPYTSERTPPSPQPVRPVLDLPTPEG